MSYCELLLDEYKNTFLADRAVLEKSAKATVK